MSAREGPEQERQRPACRQQLGERRRGGAGRAHLAGRQHQVPGVEPLRLRHARQQALALVALDGDRPQVTAAVPGQDLVEAPLAEGAVVVVEDDALRLGRRDGHGIPSARRGGLCGDRRSRYACPAISPEVEGSPVGHGAGWPAVSRCASSCLPRSASARRSRRRCGRCAPRSATWRFAASYLSRGHRRRRSVALDHRNHSPGLPAPYQHLVARPDRRVAVTLDVAAIAQSRTICPRRRQTARLARRLVRPTRPRRSPVGPSPRPNSPLSR